MFGIENYNEKIVDFANFEFSQLFEALIFGGAMLLLGMAAVFLVLLILWLFLVLFKLVFHDLPNRRKAKKVEPAPVKVTETINGTGSYTTEEHFSDAIFLFDGTYNSISLSYTRN